MVNYSVSDKLLCQIRAKVLRLFDYCMVSLVFFCVLIHLPFYSTGFR